MQEAAGSTKPRDKEVASGPEVQVGRATFVGSALEGCRTANGEIFHNRELVAAHPRLPLGTVVWVTNLENGKSVVVRIVDHGPGIPRRVVDRIFDAFERGSPAGDGTGLGLAIARGFVQANGGRVWAESEPGRGASFSVAFPVAQTRAAAT